jgi:hypothetical protein
LKKTPIVKPLHEQISVRRIGTAANFVAIELGTTDLCRISRRTENDKEFIDIVFQWDDWKIETTPPTRGGKGGRAIRVTLQSK